MRHNEKFMSATQATGLYLQLFGRPDPSALARQFGKCHADMTIISVYS